MNGGDARTRPGGFIVLSVRVVIMTLTPPQFFKDLARFLTPAPPALDGEYDGLEYSWNIFVFRPARE